MPRGLDHIVHVVRDLDAAGELYRRLGFTVGARNRHPWGTHNRIVQFPGVFIELLAIGEPEKIAPRGPGLFSFGEFNRDFVARHEGLSMLVLESRDAATDAAAFRAAGIGDFEVFHFEREARRPDGSPVKVAFSLAYASDPLSPEAGFFVCQQHFPQNFWNPAFQTHANTASGVAGVVLVAERPHDHGAFLSAFAGVGQTDAAPERLVVRTPRGKIEVVTADEFRRRFEAPPPAASPGLRMAGLRICVRDLPKAGTILAASRIEFTRKGEHCVIPASATKGATFVLEEAGEHW